MTNNTKQPNPYILALVTALLSGLFAVIGIYFTSIYREEQIKLSKEIEFQTGSYLTFLDKINSGKSEVITKIQYIGALADKSATDREFQEVEDYIAELSPQIDAQLLVELNQEFNLLKLAGSKQVRKNVDDIFYTLANRYHDLDTSLYPLDVQRIFIWFHPYIESIRPEQLSNEGQELLAKFKPWSVSDISYVDTKVSDEERFSIIFTAKLFETLLDTLQYELKSFR